MMRGSVLSLAKRFVFFLLLASPAAAQVSVLTQRYDSARVGLNANETTLTLSNVNTSTFGKLFSLPVDGYVYAQPLYVPNVTIPANGNHNVVYIATEHDSVYAYDADGLQSQPLWTVNLATRSCPNGWTCTSVPASADTATTDLLPEVGITSTPVIDPSTNTLYVVAKTQEVSGSTTNFVYRLHALDITTGAERSNSPVVIQGQVSGTGNPNNSGFLVFSPHYSLQRPGLVLVNNAVYIAFGSWGDDDIWHGWVFGYATSSLAQLAVFSVTPNGSEGRGGIWMHGHGLGADANGYLYFSTGNGGFDGIANYGDSFLKLATPSLTIFDYFTPFNQSILDGGDLDVASGGLTLLPDSAGTATHPHIMIGCGKNGAIYVIDRDSMGHFNSSNDSQIIQELLNVIGGTQVSNNSGTYVENCYSSPAYWQGNVYWGGIGDSVKMFGFTNGLMSTSALSHSSEVYQYPGTSPVVSANGATQGIVWTIENNGPTTSDSTGTTAILHAYDATNLTNELYNSQQVASDSAGAPVKYTMPVVVNGKVYVGTKSSVAVFGLKLPAVTSVAPSDGPPAGGTAVTITGTNFAPGATVTFGSNAATNVAVVNGTTITATTPAGSVGAVTVTVTVNGQSGSLASGFTYDVPATVSSVSPNTGSTAGGTAVTITGTNFAAGATVTFGSNAATNVVVVSG
ncbi:MAG: IPT/TIG domain-containing protein, partial [Candidatus Acidiferrales bacterium]